MKDNTCLKNAHMNIFVIPYRFCSFIVRPFFK